MTWAFISWRSIIAGAVTAIAISIVMAILGVALGFTIIKPTSSDPFAGLGTAFGVWSIISVIVSLAAGGYMAGLVSGSRGVEHGFMVWATVLLVGTLFSGLAVGAATKTVGTAVRGLGSGAAQVASGVGQGVASLAGSAVEAIQDGVNLNIDTDEIRGDVASVLRDTGVETLQPAFLQQQMREARGDLRTALTQVRLDANNFDDVLTAFLDKQKSRLDNITKDVDRGAAVTALQNNRGLSQAEAERAVDNAIAAYNGVVAQAQGALNEAQQQLSDTRDHLRAAAAQARVKAEEYSRTAAKSAFAAAVALILGAVLCCVAGSYGSRHYSRYGRSILIEETKGIEIPIQRNLEGQL